MRIRVAICDDDRQYLLSLAEVIQRDAGLDLVATVRSGAEALSITKRVDVWLMDIQLPSMLGTEAARRLRRADATTRVILMTSYGTGHVLDSLAGGASGFLQKTEPVWAVPAIIRCAHAGLHVGSEIVTASIVGQMEGLVALAPERAERLVRDHRDAELLRLVRCNARIDEMARAINLSVPGTKKRLGKLFVRAGVRNQQQLVNWLYDATDEMSRLAEGPATAPC